MIVLGGIYGRVVSLYRDRFAGKGILGLDEEAGRYYCSHYRITCREEDVGDGVLLALVRLPG